VTGAIRQPMVERHEEANVHHSTRGTQTEGRGASWGGGGPIGVPCYPHPANCEYAPKRFAAVTTRDLKVVTAANRLASRSKLKWRAPGSGIKVSFLRWLPADWVAVVSPRSS
jgi:hypothetical protein